MQYPNCWFGCSTVMPAMSIHRFCECESFFGAKAYIARAAHVAPFDRGLL